MGEVERPLSTSLGLTDVGALFATPRRQSTLSPPLPSFQYSVTAGAVCAVVFSHLRLHPLLTLPPETIVLLHYPKAAPGQTLNETIAAQWAAVDEFARAGKARAAGVSQFCAAALAALNATLRRAPTAAAFPTLHQAGWHVGMGRDPFGIVSSAAAYGMELMAYSPLAEANPQLLNGTLERELADRHGVTTAQIALRWLAQRGVPFAVAASNPAYQRENLDVLSFTLSADEMAQLDAERAPAGCPFWPGSACWAMTCNRSTRIVRSVRPPAAR